MSAVMGSRKPGSAGILIYHRIAPNVEGLPEPGLNVSPDQFRFQLEGLLERGFRFISLRTLIERTEAGKRIGEKTAVVTFDDAFAGVHRWALPVLVDLEIPATVFVVTQYAGRTVPMHFDIWGSTHHAEAHHDTWRSMTWEECRSAEKTGLVELGCHTHAHDNFTGKIQAFREDIRKAQSIFKEQLGAERRLFAVPYGDPTLGQVDAQLLEAAQQEGLLCALTTRLGLVEPGQSPFGWKRLEVVQQDSGATLAAKIEGWYDWMGAVKTVVHRVSPW
jgi:peptidoglycan/xylan/chitin deacetylase (PgdA/CDA1 family)